MIEDARQTHNEVPRGFVSVRFDVVVGSNILGSIDCRSDLFAINGFW